MTHRVKPRLWLPGPASLPDPVAFAVALGNVAQGYRWANRPVRQWLNSGPDLPGYWYALALAS